MKKQAGADIMNRDWQALQIRNRQNLKLAALLKTAKHPEEQNDAGSQKSALIIVCHGFTGSKEGSGQAVAMGNELALLGFSTLLFDFAGCGESEGNWEDLTLTGQIDDLGSVVEWSRLQGYKQIILTGRSFGGSTIIGYAARDKDINAVCTWAAVARPDKLFSHFIKGRESGAADELLTIESDEAPLKLRRAFFNDLNRHDLPGCAATIAPRKLLVIHGSADQSVPCADAELIYQSALEPKEMVIIDGADHRFSSHTNQVWALFFDWLKRL
jgi:uncharacterized protein